MQPTSEQQAPREKLSLFQVAVSTLAAAFGVQSGKNWERDFKAGSAKTFIVAGIVGTVLFISALILVVRLVLG
ncbi:MAG: DUF2970 domain-containing protein [Methylococcaceae bacterium]|nr:MAG: DUF2970 domain-containing protein [Methylococcaceae bacterium]